MTQEQKCENVLNKISSSWKEMKCDLKNHMLKTHELHMKKTHMHYMQKKKRKETKRGKK